METPPDKATGIHNKKFFKTKFIRYCLLLPLQIAQFFFNVCYNLNALFRLGEACNFPLWMMKLSSWYNASFIVLFSNFYLKSYARDGGGKPKNA